jgi:CheY-like chemotaxis protein
MPPRVLVVDDHEETTMVYAEVLRGLGFDVVATTDPNRALHLAVAHRPDVMVVDIMMPRMDGCELGTLIRSYAKTRGVRLIAVSAHAFDFSKYLMPPGGWDACLRKPCDPTVRHRRFARCLRASRSAG